MRIAQLNLQHFRNIALASLEFAGTRQFLVGDNGQGKTALLEAAGFITALRSFRTADQRLLIAQGHGEAAIVCTVEHEQRGATMLTYRLRPGSKDVLADQERVVRLADYLGRFPTVVFSSQDQQLVRGSPGGRRRWLDLTMAAMNPAYLMALQGYHRALAGRNALLKQGAGGEQLEAFERPLAQHGAVLISARAAGLEAIGVDLTAAYARLADAAEPAGFTYAPDLTVSSEGDLRARFAAGRARDAALRTTLTGPHRDDFDFTLSARAARDFASEGQQRSLVLALRLAQAAYFLRLGGIKPVLLADDVLGELDPDRRRRFWEIIPHDSQVIATGTAVPDSSDGAGAWQVFAVRAGAFTLQP